MLNQSVLNQHSEMAKLLCVLITLVILYVNNPAAGQATNRGVPTVTGAFPSVVSITSTVGVPNCLGNVVNEWHVLTAASCVVQLGTVINPFWLTVTGGDLRLDFKTWMRVERNVTAVYPHFQFNAISNANNLAVIRVGARFPLPHNTIEAAVLATQPITTECRFAGWSAITVGENQPIDQVQREFNVQMHQPATCNPHLPTQLLDGMICGGNAGVQGPGPCTGALGGGLYCGTSMDNQLVGILAFGINCGAANPPNVFIEVRRHIPWINQQFLRNMRFRPGTMVHQTGGTL